MAVCCLPVFLPRVECTQIGFFLVLQCFTFVFVGVACFSSLLITMAVLLKLLIQRTKK